jgi:hypothetical protein
MPSGGVELSGVPAWAGFAWRLMPTGELKISESTSNNRKDGTLFLVENAVCGRWEGGTRMWSSTSSRSSASSEPLDLEIIWSDSRASCLRPAWTK